MLTDKQATGISKFLSFVLRHKPEEIGLTLDERGWVDVDVLLAAARREGKPLTREMLDYIVATNSKKRFEYSEDGTRIRASQGHSVEVDLGYSSSLPPVVLYHGTVAAAVADIMQQGLMKMQRHHVHLSANVETAKNVGGRRGKPVVLIVYAGSMAAAGHQFFVSTNGVWLTDHVPPEYISFLEGA